jgi:hypothetical protein
MIAMAVSSRSIYRVGKKIVVQIGGSIGQYKTTSPRAVIPMVNF